MEKVSNFWIILAPIVLLAVVGLVRVADPFPRGMIVDGVCFRKKRPRIFVAGMVTFC